MSIGRMTLALAVAMVAGPVTSEVSAQELTLPPAPSSATESGGTAFSAENGPCFYNPYTWVVRGAVNQTLIAAEMKDLAGGWEANASGCLGHYGLTSYDFFGSWAYMLSDGVPQPERVSQKKVKAVWEASRKAAAEAEERARPGHVRVPQIGDSYGSDEMVSRTLVLRVAPRSGIAPATYHGIPIIDRDRSWERFEAPDGRRVWRQVDRGGDSYRTRAGVRTLGDVQARFGSSAADRQIQLQEGIRSMQRSMPRSPAASGADDRSPSASSGSSSSSGTGVASLRRGKKGGEQ